MKLFKWKGLEVLKLEEQYISLLTIRLDLQQIISMGDPQRIVPMSQNQI